MLSKVWSFFLAGILLGILLTTWVFSMLPGDNGANTTRTVLKLAHVVDANHPVHLAMLRMAEILREKSGGTVELQVFPNSQLGSETQCIEQLQHGALAMTKSSTALLESFLPELAILGYPYLFRDEAHCWRVLDGEIGKSLLQLGTRIGLRGLCFYDAGARSFYTVSKPILSPDDLKGLKIRVQESRTAMDMVAALGAAPTPIAFGELYTALQQRMVDGAENNPPSFFANRHYEVCKHLSLDEHTRVPDILLISESTWQSLPPHVQQWLQEAADESSAFQRQLWRDTTEDCLADLVAKGVIIHHPDQETFAEKVSALKARYAESEAGKLMHQIQQQ